MLEIRKATEEDKPEIWKIIKAVIATGDTYVFAPDSGEEEMLAYWMSPEKWTYVAVWSEPPASAGGLNADASNNDSSDLNGKIVGTFFLKANQPDLGSHVGNAGYMVAPEAKGKRVGRTMAEYSLEESRKLGFKAIQFNFVVKSNEVAVKLWQDVGFEIIGEIPEAFNHARNGLTNAYIMYRKL
jgi:ribosomal protein S18 acetylase RimI-like enzyme